MKKLFLLFSLLIPFISFAQSYTIDWYKVAGGGGAETKATPTPALSVVERKMGLSVVFAEFGLEAALVQVQSNVIALAVIVGGAFD